MVVTREFRVWLSAAACAVMTTDDADDWYNDFLALTAFNTPLPLPLLPSLLVSVVVAT